MGEVGGESEPGDGDGCPEEVIRAHHLRSGIRFESCEDIILRRVREAIEQQIDPQQ